MAGYIGSKAVSVNTTSATISDDLAVGDDASVAGDLSVTGDYSSTTAGTSNLRLGVNAGNSIASGGNYNVCVGDEAGTAINTGDVNTFIGYQSGDATTTSGNNVGVGYASLGTNIVSSKNVAIGNNALKTHNLGSAGDGLNVAVGHGAGEEVSTGTVNTLIGGLAGNALDVGAANVAVGYAALATEDGDGNNVAVGYLALTTQNVGADGHNTGVGHKAGRLITSGIRNTIVGALAGDALTDADDNVAVGMLALSTCQLGSANTAVGKDALEDCNPASAVTMYNSAFGQGAAANLTTAIKGTFIGARSGGGASLTGNENTCVGYDSGIGLTSGVQNTFVGSQAGDQNTDGSNNVAIGFQTLGADSADDNVAVGVQALQACTGGNNAALGPQAGLNATSAYNCTFLGHDAGVTGSPGGNHTGGHDEILFGNGAVSVANIQVDWTVASDQRDKTDFTALDIGLDFIKALAPVTYKWDKRSKYGDKYADDYDLNEQTPDGTHKEDWLDVGFKAQEVEALEQAAGYNKSNKTNLVTSLTADGKQYGMQYSKFIPILVKAIQEQNALIEALTARIATLEG